MKKAITYLGLITILFMVTGCVSSHLNDDEDLIEDTDPEGNGSDGSLTAKVDGVSFTAASNKVEAKKNVFASGDMSFSVTAKNKDLNKFTLIVSNYKGVGSYDAETNSLSYHVNGDDRPHTATKLKSSGVITITSDDGTTVKGTFSFTGTHQTTKKEKVITEGAFTVKPQVKKV